MNGSLTNLMDLGAGTLGCWDTCWGDRKRVLQFGGDPEHGGFLCKVCGMGFHFACCKEEYHAQVAAVEDFEEIEEGLRPPVCKPCFAKQFVALKKGFLLGVKFAATRCKEGQKAALDFGNTQDPRTLEEALHEEEGVEYVAEGWESFMYQELLGIAQRGIPLVKPAGADPACPSTVHQAARAAAIHCKAVLRPKVRPPPLLEMADLATTPAKAPGATMLFILGKTSHCFVCLQMKGSNQSHARLARLPGPCSVGRPRLG